MSPFAAAPQSLRDLYLHELRNLYNAEVELLEALTKMAKVGASPRLRESYAAYVEEIRHHLRRLEQIFSALRERRGGFSRAALMAPEEDRSVAGGEEADL